MDADTIESLACEIIAALDLDEKHRAYALAGEIKGLCQQNIREQSKWGLIREDYETGIPPRLLAGKYGVGKREVIDRAYREKWVSPRKIKRALKPAKKQVFYPVCRECEKKFEATSGSAIVCPTCKAFAAHEKAERRVKEA